MPSLPPAWEANLLVDADDLAVGVEQRAAGVAGVDRGVGLDATVIVAPFGDCSSRSVCARRRRRRARSRGRAGFEGDDLFTDGDLGGVAQLHRDQPGRLTRVDLEQRHVGRLIGADDGGRIWTPSLPSLLKTTVTVLAVRPLSLTTWALVRVFAVGGDDEAGADALLLAGGLAPHVGGAGERRDGLDDACHVLLVDLLRRQPGRLERGWFALDGGLLHGRAAHDAGGVHCTSRKRAAQRKPATMVPRNLFILRCLSCLCPSNRTELTDGSA